jgi:hypothetical protein
MNDAKPVSADAKLSAAIDPRLAEFEQHKEPLIRMLRDQHSRGGKSKRFDEQETWQQLKFFALTYLLNEVNLEQKNPTTPNGIRRDLLRQLSKSLGKARCKLDEVMQSDVRGQLFLAWCEANGNPDLLDPIIEHYDTRFEKIVASLAELEAAATNAANNIFPQRGTRKGTAVLPCEVVLSLADLYLNSTGARPVTGDGPFAQLVAGFLAALGRYNDDETKRIPGAIKYETVVDVIADCRTYSLHHWTGRASSPFEGIRGNSTIFG